MRKLTQNEIDNAPEWATHYAVQDGYLRWSDEEFYMWEHHKTKGQHNNIFLTEPKPIPCKEFDIDDCELQCGGGSFCVVNGTLYLTINLIDAEIQKQDAINQAKYFKLTASDLS